MSAKFRANEVNIGSAKFYGLYLMAMILPCGNFAVKIGITATPGNRYMTFQTILPFESVMKWTIIGAFHEARETELALHEMFKENHTRGEWFLFSPNEGEELNSRVNDFISERLDMDLVWVKVDPLDSKKIRG